MNRRALFWTVATATLIGYGAWVVWYEAATRRRALMELDQHAAVVAPALWHLDPTLCQDYLELAARSQVFELLQVRDENETAFASASGPRLRGVDALLQRLGLIPRVTHQRPLVYEGRVIGRIEGIRHLRTIHAELAVLMGLFLGWGLLERHLRVREMRDALQVEVAERTRELTETNAALRTSEARYRSSVEQSPDLFCRFTAEGVLTYVNPAYCRFFGKRCDELVGRRFWPLIPEPDRATVESLLQRGLSPEMEPLTLEHRVMAGDGSLRWVRWTHSAVRDDQGRFLDYQAIGHDITEQKQAQLELARSHEIYRRAISAAAAVPYQIELPSNRCVFAGEGFQALTGVEPGSLATGRLCEMAEEILLMGRCAGLGVEEALRQLAAGTLDHWQAEYRFRTPGGEVRWISDSAVPVRNDEGEVVGVLGILQDITERRRTAEEHVRLAAAVEAVEEAVFVTDVNGVILYTNPAFERITGFERTEALGQTPRILKSGRHPVSFYREMWETILAGRSWIGRVTNRRKDGRLYEAEAIISPIRDAAGRITHFVAVSRDITERVQLEERLRASQKLEAIGRLAAGIAHEFNNILTIIQGNALLMNRDALGPDDATCVDQIVQASQRAAELTRRLLIYSRQQPMQTRAVDVGELLHRTARMLAPVLGEMVRLRLQMPAELPVIRADPGLLEQMLVNLAVNARDAMPQGGELTFSAAVCEFGVGELRHQPEATPGRYICLSVRDTGTGIAPEHMPHLFEPFFTTKEVGKGTGLGLASVYGTVQQHHGWIEVESQVGEGTCFRIYLPVGEPEQSAAGAGPEPRVLPRGQETLLVVEDDPSLARLTEGVLRRCGYRVWTAGDAESALALWALHQAEIDLVLTDVVLSGGVSGVALAKRLMEAKPGLKVVYTSGYFEEPFREEVPLVEGENFLPKPYRPHELAGLIRRCLDRG
ncbi:PAS domain S-box protein [Limisphaera ngatamarikiensis]|uniref:histidine kinase n=1 Tax=Limisphaera ngatamarikiensis TaxID=1324935 RepID=A0A6M1RZ31_9BACT|nr:PAS domain S-box protein [Limisphaera ngatamarikiensis]NGO38420.1 PAS domain S-box protein [Limisphaera ngatamarikiensis]